MFNNRFNSTKTDPLVEAVKVAQADGEMRRQAVAHVNEQFGVYNRNAIVREQLAAYDAAIEEAYKCMKEGKPLSPKQQKMAAVAGDPKKIDAADLKALRSGKKMEEKKDCYEGNDGNLANNYPPYDKVTRGDVIAGATGKDQMGGKKKMDEKKGCYEEGMDSDVVGGGAVTKDSKPVVSSTASKVDTSGPSAADKAGLAAKIGAMKEAKLDEAVSRKHFQQVADLIKGHESQEKRNELASHHAGIFSKQNPRFDHGRFHKAAGSTAHEAPAEKKMEEAAYSAKAARAGKDIGKPGKMFSKIAKKAGKSYGSEERGKKVAGAILKRIRAKHMREQVTLMPTAAAKSSAAKSSIIPKSALAPGQSLRDYMNAEKGLTRRDAPSAKPSAGPVGQAGLKGPNSSGFGTTSPSVRWKDPVTAGKTADKPAATPAPEPKAKEWQAPMSVAPKAPDQADTIRQSGGSVPSSMTKAAPSMALDGGKPSSGASAPVSTPTINPSKPSNVPDSVAASKPPVSTPGPSTTSLPSMAADPKAMKLKESVQVGANKYRIF